MNDSDVQNGMDRAAASENKAQVKPPPLPKVAPLPIPVPDVDTPWLKGLAMEFGEKALGIPVACRDTILIAVLAFVADQCLYKESGGLGMACVLIASVVGMFIAFRQSATRQRMMFALVICLVSAMMIWRHWWLLGVVGWVSAFLLSVKSFRPDWKLPSAVLAAAATALRAPLRLFGHLTAHYFREKDGVSVKWYRRIPGRVIVLPLAVCVVFVLIFSAANPVIARLMELAGEAIGGWLTSFFDFVTPFRIFIWVLWMMVFAALIRPVIEAPFINMLGKLNESLVRSEIKVPDKGNFNAALSTLVLVNLLFLAYNCLDAVYLYFKATLPEGIDWAVYTHSGCGWLTFALFVSSAVTGFIFWDRLNFHPRSHQLKCWSYVWAFQNAVLAVGAIRRIQMYIDFSGLTHLRITGIYGALLIMAGLAVMVCKVRSDRSLIWLVRKYVWAFSIAVLCLALTPLDYVCTKYNVQRVLEGKKHAMRPISLKVLSPEALPHLIPLLDYERQDGDEAKEKIVRRGIAGLLGLALQDLEKQSEGAWTTRQISSVWALKRLRKIDGRICAIALEAEWYSARKIMQTNYDLNE